MQCRRLATRSKWTIVVADTPNVDNISNTMALWWFETVGDNKKKFKKTNEKEYIIMKNYKFIIVRNELWKFDC